MTPVRVMPRMASTVPVSAKAIEPVRECGCLSFTARLLLWATRNTR